MHLHITTFLFVLLEQIYKICTQGMPMSPCPKIFQYRFDGTEWYGVLSVRNPDFQQALHLKVTISIRGKPVTSYLGDIELLTRGQFRSDAPVLYKVKFPKAHVPPRLLQIMANNQVVCLGTADHSIFVTQITLEHTRKFKFLPHGGDLPGTVGVGGFGHGDDDAVDDNNHDGGGGGGGGDGGGLPMQLTPGFASPSAGTEDGSAMGIAGGGEDAVADDDDGGDNVQNDGGGAFIDGITAKETDSLPSAGHAGFGTKHLPLAAHKNPMRSYQEICGRIDDRVRFQVLHAMSLPTTPAERLRPAAVALSADRTHLQSPTKFETGIWRKGARATMPLVTADAGHSALPDSVGGAASPAAAATTGGSQHGLSSITRGAWPWMAAIYVNNLTSLSYQCGGTLVAARVVISSAHCFHMFQQRYTANEVLVFLGRHNLKNWNEDGSLAAPVDDIFLHPDYDRHLNTYDADIAVVLLKHPTRFNTFIRPACMWSGSTQSRYIEGELGAVVGWGLANQRRYDQAGQIGFTGTASASPVPRVVSATIISNEACFKVNEQFHSLSSNRTFCAGTVTTSPNNFKSKSSLSQSQPQTKESQQSSTPSKLSNARLCTGDSGAGLMIYKNHRWILRGTVSASVPLQRRTEEGGDSRTSCDDLHHYVIYTDVAKYLDWIFAFII